MNNGLAQIEPTKCRFKVQEHLKPQTQPGLLPQNKKGPEMSELRLLACQTAIPLTPDSTARDAHVAALCSRISAATEPGTLDLIVLPELSTIEYSDEAFTRIDGLAEPLIGPSYQRFAALAQNTNATVVYGFPRKTDTGTVICQAAVAPDGILLGHYDKLHLAQFGASAEAAAFRPGNHIFMFNIKGLKVALAICYDIRFLDLARRLAADRVDLVLQCSAYARDLSFHSWRSFVVTRAMENGFAWLGLNRAGVGWGGSIWCPGFADSVHPEQVFGSDEEFRPLNLPTDFRTRNAEKLPFLVDKRNDYAKLPVNSADRKVEN